MCKNIPEGAVTPLGMEKSNAAKQTKHLQEKHRNGDI